VAESGDVATVFGPGLSAALYTVVYVLLKVTDNAGLEPCAGCFG
jgi:hypothetical protein